jgi:hypothetical protein
LQNKRKKNLRNLNCKNGYPQNLRETLADMLFINYKTNFNYKIKERKICEILTVKLVIPKICVKLPQILASPPDSR